MRYVHRVVRSCAAVLLSVLALQGQALRPERPSCGTHIPVGREAALGLRSFSGPAFQVSELLLYLDMDGAVVSRGIGVSGYTSPIINFGIANCPAPSLTQTQKDEIVRRVADDYSPFNIRVTTSIDEFNATAPGLRQIAIVTTVPGVIGHLPTTGGVAPWSGLGVRTISSPSFIFSNVYGSDPAEVANVISHESGHTMGLGHQSLYGPSCEFIAEYHPVFGSGPLSFGAIMGFTEDSAISNWFSQECVSPFDGLAQHDFELLNSQVSLRPDDFPDEPTGSVLPAGATSGVIGVAGDVDFLKLSLRSPGPITVSSNNIDLKVSVLAPGGRLLSEYDDPAGQNVTIPSAAGVRFLKIEAAGNVNVSAQFLTGIYTVAY